MSAVSDDREEGEIVDDDFEDISDNSIIVPIFSGKSVSSKEHLPAISLSSVSEVEESKGEEKIRRRQKSRRKNSKSYKKRRTSHRTSTHSDSDSDDYLELNKTLQKQLKAAIKVDDDLEGRHINSLRSRLRAMTKLDNDSDNSVEKIDNDNSKIEEKVSSDEGDTELNELRLEALRTAVLNKFMHRKKRKMKEIQDNEVLSDISIKTDISETNKENAHNTNENINVRIEENCSKKLCLEKSVENVDNKIQITNNIVIESNTPPEEDEDVLRALLLASMSKKITSETDLKKTALPSSNVNIGIKQAVPIRNLKSQAPNLTLKNSTHFKNRIVKNNVVVSKHQTVQLPKVKPLIINVDTDSDSDDDVLNKTRKINEVVELKPVDKDIENTVEKFLKEQRAKVEAQLSPIPKPTVNVNNSSVILEKSSVKLLPKVKQIEYHKLLQKLKNAEKKRRIRRSSFKLNGEGKPVGVTSKKFVKAKAPVNKQTSAGSKVEQMSDIRTEARILHRMLKEMQIQTNGRLQIQEKYKVLMPIVKKINESSVERKKCDEDVKRLLQELGEAKKKLFKCQQNFTAYVRELVNEKQAIDKSSRRPTVVEDSKTRFTSTPIRGEPSETFETSSITTTPNQTIQASDKVDVKMAQPSFKARVEENVTDAPLNQGDPSDIDKICDKQKCSLPKYISPLDNAKRVVMDDPFSIICPYDVDGNCRDPECIYKHLFK